MSKCLIQVKTSRGPDTIA